MFRKVAKGIYWLVVIVLLGVALGVAFSIVPTPWGYRLFIVQSASMEPAIGTGSVVIVVPQGKYSKGDIVSFLNSPTEDLKKAGATTTHRIVKKNNSRGRITFTTKGDANEDTDRRAILKGAILGRVSLTIPYIGYAVGFAKTQLGLIVLIIIPATIIVYSEVVNIKREVGKLIKKGPPETDQPLAEI